MNKAFLKSEGFKRLQGPQLTFKVHSTFLYIHLAKYFPTIVEDFNVSRKLN